MAKNKSFKILGIIRLPRSKWTFTLVALVALLSTGLASIAIYSATSGINPLAFYANLANPYMRFVNIQAGLRREEIAAKLQKILEWDNQHVQDFLKTAPVDDRGLLDGYYAPGPYWINTNSTGTEVAHMMLRAFNDQVSEQILGNKDVNKKATLIKNGDKINLDTAVRIASLIQREAGSKSDMRIISGIIWNRLFRGMSLDIDATLQYAKGDEKNWWPRVTGKDKFIDSDFNTYQNLGLPPMAIANPSIEAIKAAYNPAKTDCLFYLQIITVLFTALLPTPLISKMYRSI
jgi:UPF0755 protein